MQPRSLCIKKEKTAINIYLRLFWGAVLIDSTTHHRADAVNVAVEHVTSGVGRAEQNMTIIGTQRREHKVVGVNQSNLPSLESLPNSDGMGPLRLLLSMASIFIFFSNPYSVGIVPMKSPQQNCSASRLSPRRATSRGNGRPLLVRLLSKPTYTTRPESSHRIWSRLSRPHVHEHSSGLPLVQSSDVALSSPQSSRPKATTPSAYRCTRLQSGYNS